MVDELKISELKIGNPVAWLWAVEECSKTTPKHPKTAAEASRSGRFFTSIHTDSNNMGVGELPRGFSETPRRLNHEPRSTSSNFSRSFPATSNPPLRAARSPCGRAHDTNEPRRRPCCGPSRQQWYLPYSTGAIGPWGFVVLSVCGHQP